MKVKFLALMKELNVKSLVSLDKGAWLKLEFNAVDDELLSALNRLMKPDAEVKVTIEE